MCKAPRYDDVNFGKAREDHSKFFNLVQMYLNKDIGHHELYDYALILGFCIKDNVGNKLLYKDIREGTFDENLNHISPMYECDFIEGTVFQNVTSKLEYRGWAHKYMKMR